MSFKRHLGDMVTLLKKCLTGFIFRFVRRPLDRKDSAIDYYYTSRLPGEDEAGIADIHFQPIEPIIFRIRLTATF
jgi:hypothetical protein